MPGRKFNPGNMAILDRPERMNSYDLGAIIAAACPEKGMVIADIGAGTGSFSVPLAGAASIVYAVDVSPEMLEYLEGKLAGLEITNIETVLSTEESIPLPDEAVDAVFMSNVFHELEGTGTLAEVKRIMKPGARLVIMDWRKEHDVQGPPYHHRLSQAEVRETCVSAGLNIAEEFDTGSDSKYGLIFSK